MGPKLQHTRITSVTSYRYAITPGDLASMRSLVDRAAAQGRAKIIDGYVLAALTVAPGGAASWWIETEDGTVLVECRLSPWPEPDLTATLFPALLNDSRHFGAVHWLGDCERLVAWAILEGAGRRS